MFNEQSKNPLCASYHTKFAIIPYKNVGTRIIIMTVSSNLQYTTSFIKKKTQNQGYIGQILP
jgi:hypothetical protein